MGLALILQYFMLVYHTGFVSTRIALICFARLILRNPFFEIYSLQRVNCYHFSYIDYDGRAEGG